MCSVMCAVIDMLTSSFQAAASKPRLATLIGFSGVCGCIRQCNLRHSLVYSLFSNAQLSSLFALCLANLSRLQQKNIIMKMLDCSYNLVWLSLLCVHPGRAVTQSTVSSIKILLNLTRRLFRYCNLKTLCLIVNQNTGKVLASMYKYVLSPMQTHPACSPSHFINNAYMQGFNGDTVTFALSSLNYKPSSLVSECLISSCDQPTKSQPCKMVHKQSHCITGNIIAIDT